VNVTKISSKVLLTIIFTTKIATAAIVTVSNPGFEADALADGNISLSVPTGWTLSGSIGGYFDPDVATYGYPAGENNLAFFFNPSAEISLYQNTGYVIAPGDIISLSIDFGKRGGLAIGDPLNGSTAFGIFDALTGLPIATRTVSPSDLGATGTLNTVTLLYPSVVGDAGKEIRIRVSADSDGTSGSDFVDFDNVALDVVPEPSSVLLVAAGVFNLLYRRRNGTSRSVE
jgi:hypothetical protein